MNNALKVALGIVASIGGFLDVGTIATTSLAGAVFRFQLLWALVLGTVCVILLTEMCGRLAAVSHHTLADAIRERLGFPYFALPLVGELLIDALVLAAEIGGVAIALHLLIGGDYRLWVPFVSLAVWLLLWTTTFGVIENGVSFAGLITVGFVATAIMIRPPWPEVAAGIVPTLPRADAARYWFTAVSIIGSVIAPYVLNFYASGAVEEKWSTKDLVVNRVVAGIGMSFGSVIALSILVLSALVLAPRGIQVDSYEQAALILIDPLGRWGLVLFAVSLGVTCLGAALQVALNVAYVLSQGLGWNWSENLRPYDDARFSLTYTVAILVGGLLVIIGGDPLRLTMLSMALNAVVAPFVVFPLLILMNDPAYVKQHSNGIVGNVLVAGIIILAFAVAIVAIPLEILGG